MKKLFLWLVLSLITLVNVQAQTPEFWGMTAQGGDENFGTLFKTDGIGNNHSVEFHFTIDDGINPYYLQLCEATNGRLYGMTYQGGSSNLGVLFEYDPSTNAYTKKLDFSGSAKGSYPLGSLMQASNGKLYGMTKQGGTSNEGVLFEYDPSTNTFTKKVDFNGYAKGSYPRGSLMQASNGILYGMTREGGSSNRGVLFEYDPSTNTYTNKLDFSSYLGSYPRGALIQASNGKLYGMTEQGGTFSRGVLFEYDPSTNTYTKKLDFDGTGKGKNPYGSLMQATNGKLYGMTRGGGSANRGVLFEYDPSTNSITNKIDFDGTAKGRNPYGSLMQATNGKLYGMTADGGTSGLGVLFEYDSSTNTFTKKIDFDGTAKGSDSYGSLMQATNGKLYGVTRTGGTLGFGVLFEYDPSTNTFNKKLDFNSTNKGTYPYGSLLKANNGKLYGIDLPGRYFRLRCFI